MRRARGGSSGWRTTPSWSPELSHHERGEFLETIRKNADALLGLINDVLDLSRIEAERLARALGGDVEVSSELGKGSTFTLTIDAGPPGGLPAPQRVPGAPAGEEGPPAEQGGPALQGRVLLAEDVPDVQLVIAEILRKASRTT